MGDVARRLAVLGSTGSIGTQTLSVVRAYPDRFQVVGIGARRGSDTFLAQVQEFQPALVSLSGPGDFWDMTAQPVSLEEMASHPDVDVVVVAIPGLAALAPTLAALRAGKAVALASKEVLVVAGRLAMEEAARTGAPILPVDSEHNALWQCLVGERGRDEVARLILTASGGPFRDWTLEEMAAVTPAQALAHPTWRMGPKVTVDSATLMNKGFEVMEAHWLYGVLYERIGVVVHPQSIVHSLVEFADGTLKAQLSNPSMTLPIQYALTYPERWERPMSLRSLDLAAMGPLTFEAVDEEKFRCFRLARRAAESGDTYPAVLSAADEEAVALFLARRIPFLAIPSLIEEVLSRHTPVTSPSLDDLLEADAWARRHAHQYMGVALS
jgi:1-deoxy-D-xylulose-5-phosphate reductoisomerase